VDGYHLGSAPWDNGKATATGKNHGDMGRTDTGIPSGYVKIAIENGHL
jgi:hypothetical protein